MEGSGHPPTSCSLVQAFSDRIKDFEALDVQVWVSVVWVRCVVSVVVGGRCGGGVCGRV